MRVKIAVLFVGLIIISIFTGLVYGQKIYESSEGKDKIAVIIDQDLYSQISHKFNRYIEDVERIFPVTLTTHKVEELINQKTKNSNSICPENIREILIDEYKTNNIKGALLVGQIPFAIWEQEIGGNVGISSIFYEDMDGTFEDKDNNGFYDYHNFGPNEGPEIWISWIRPPAFAQAFYMNRFLDKTHNYYTGKFVTQKKALIACHEDYDNNFEGQVGVVSPLEDIYGQENVDKDGESLDITVDTEIWNKLENNFYEVFDTWQHASSNFQAWDSGGFFSKDIMTLKGGPLMTFLYGCHSADFWDAPGTTPFNINIAVSYVFGKSNGQSATGTSWSYGTEYKCMIYRSMKENRTYLGNAWFDMESFVETATFVQQRYPDRNPNTECAGNNLIGNPFLYVNYSAEDYHFKDEKPLNYNFNRFTDRITNIIKSLFLRILDFKYPDNN